MKNKPVIFLGIMGALCFGSSIAVHSDNTRVQKLGVMALGTSVLAGVGAILSVATEKDNDDDDPRMKDVYAELEARHSNEDPEPDDIDLEEDENDTNFESVQNFHNNMPQVHPKRQRSGRI